MLQGSLDNFALDEVLGLLASTAKTGKLDIKGDRGTGVLALRQGQLVGAGASNTANGSGIDDIVFELMRFTDGSFVFAAQEVESTDSGRAVPEVLASAEARLADWRTIEAVVPSLSHTVSPVPALPADEITINRREWSTLIVIGSGCPVSSVCNELDLGEVEGSRQIKILAERGLVSVGPPLGKAGAGASYGSRPPAEAPRAVADPFARRAEQSMRRVETLAGATAEANELVDASMPARARELAGSLATARPPMPQPPTTAELRRAEAGGNGRTGLLEAEATTPAAEVPAPPTSPSAAEPTKPAGLLMRYLKGED